MTAAVFGQPEERPPQLGRLHRRAPLGAWTRLAPLDVRTGADGGDGKWLERVGALLRGTGCEAMDEPACFAAGPRAPALHGGVRPEGLIRRLAASRRRR